MSYLFPLCIQLTMPENPNSPAFIKTLQCLQANGFYGVELNIIEFGAISPEELVALLGDFNLHLTMIASGGYAKKHKLSLSSTKEEIRKKSVAALAMMARYAAQCNAGVICGFMKGDTSGNLESVTHSFELSLQELCEKKVFQQADIYLEATNRREAFLVNTLAQGAHYAQTMANQFLVLPDTYHMQLEESNLIGALKKYQSYYHNVHLSDDNRYFPGFGTICFEDVLRQLKEQSYQGTIAIEGNVKEDLLSDITATAKYLKECSLMCANS